MTKQGGLHSHTLVHPSCRRGEARQPERPQKRAGSPTVKLPTSHANPHLAASTGSKVRQRYAMHPYPVRKPANDRSHDHDHDEQTATAVPYQNQGHTTATPWPATPNTRQTALEFWLGQLQTHKPKMPTPRHAMPRLSLSPLHSSSLATPATPNINQVGQ